MKSNIGKILGLAAIVFVVIVLASLVFNILAWMIGKIILAFFLAVIIWLIQTARGEATGDGFIVSWGIGLTILLVAIHLVMMFLAAFAKPIIIALIIGAILFGLRSLRKKA